MSEQKAENAGLTIEWGVLGDAFSPQPSREAAERTVERLRSGKMRVTNRHVAWRYVSAPQRADVNSPPPPQAGPPCASFWHGTRGHECVPASENPTPPGKSDR